MKSPSKVRNRMWKLISDAQSAADREVANALFVEAEKLGRQLHELQADDADHCYAIALTYYHRWGEDSERRQCMDWLNKAQELNPAHPWVPLYLGYQLMDDRKWAEAQVQFQRVDSSYFASIQHHWRNLKTEELMLVATIRQGLIDIASERLVQVVDSYIAAESVDRPIPTEIVKVLVQPEHRECFDSPASNIAAEACRLIRGIGDEKVFADELTILEAAANTDK